MRPKASILEELDKALAYFHPLTLEDFYLPEAGDEPVTRENISEKTAERFIYLYRLNIEYEHWLKLDWEQKLEHAIQNSHWTREGDYAVSRNPLDEEYVKFVIAEHKSMRRSKKYRRSRAHAIPVLPQQGDVGFERAGPDWLTEKMAADLDEELAHRGLVREGNDEVSRRPITQEFAQEMIDRYEQGLRRWYAKPELITPSPTTDGHERLGYKTQAEWEEEQRALKASMANAQKEEVGWLENLKRRLGRKRA